MKKLHHRLSNLSLKGHRSIANLAESFSAGAPPSTSGGASLSTLPEVPGNHPRDATSTRNAPQNKLRSAPFVVRDLPFGSSHVGSIPVCHSLLATSERLLMTGVIMEQQNMEARLGPVAYIFAQRGDDPALEDGRAIITNVATGAYTSVLVT